jgi:hypothetical protein
MCGRFALFHSGEDLARVFGEAAASAPKARYNIAPPGPVWALAGPPAAELRAGEMRWGYPLERGDGGEVIKARAETAYQKPLFRDDWHRRRCALPISGFYEWGGEDGARQPWLFSAKEGARRVGDANRALPRPPRPPRAATSSSPGAARSVRSACPECSPGSGSTQLTHRNCTHIGP